MKTGWNLPAPPRRRSAVTAGGRRRLLLFSRLLGALRLGRRFGGGVLRQVLRLRPWLPWAWRPSSPALRRPARQRLRLRASAACLGLGGLFGLGRRVIMVMIAIGAMDMAGMAMVMDMRRYPGFRPRPRSRLPDRRGVTARSVDFSLAEQEIDNLVFIQRRAQLGGGHRVFLEELHDLLLFARVFRAASWPIRRFISGWVTVMLLRWPISLSNRPRRTRRSAMRR